MRPSSNVIQGNASYGLLRVGASVGLLLLGYWGIETLTQVTPNILRQIEQPCAGCYRLGPPMEPYGYPFRPLEETAVGTVTPPAAIVMRTFLTNMRESQPGGVDPWLALNRTIAVAQRFLPGARLFGTGPSGAGQSGAGRIDQDTASFAAPHDADMTRGSRTSDDPQYARALVRVEPSAIGGRPMIGKPMGPWNVTSGWSFPDYRLRFELMPWAATLKDVAPAEGLGGGAIWNASWQMDLTNYRGPASDVLNTTGLVPAAGAPWIQGSIPWSRVAVQKDLERHFLQIGSYVMHANVASGDGQSAGTTDTFSDVGADANYRFIVNPGDAVSDRFSAHATLIHEAQSLDVSNRVLGANGFNTLDTFRAGASWSIADTVTPSIQYFRTAGSVEAIQSAWAGDRPNSAGVIAEVAYVPWDKPWSPMRLLNLRLAAQYVAYTEFNGNGRGASGNNAVYLSLWGALHF